MDFVYVLLFIAVLYILSRVFLNFYITDRSTQFSQVRTKAFLNLFGPAIIFGLTSLFIYLTENKEFNFVIYLGLTGGGLLRILFSSRKYLVSCNTNDSTLEIKYLTSLMKLKTYSITLVDIADIEIVQHKWFSDSPASINIKQGNDWIGFYLVDKQLVSIVKNEIASVY